MVDSDGERFTDNTTASVMGRIYAGPGAAVGRGATFADLGARDIGQRLSEGAAGLVTPA